MIQRIDDIGLCTTSACARPMSQEWSRFCVATSVTRRSGAEIHEGLNVVEIWNSANGFIFFGKGGEVASNRLEDQEVAVHALRLLQSCPVYVNTLMLQRVLAAQSGSARRRSPCVTPARPNSRVSRASSVTSSASGQESPAAAARFRLSWIVERATPRRRPISRALTPSW